MINNSEPNYKYCMVRSDSGELVQFQPESFWSDRPALWFVKMEAQLVVCNIEEDNRKYSFIVSLLDQDTALDVGDIITDPPLYDKYGTLKEQLIERTISKNEARVNEIFSNETLGDRKPSQFYNHLKNLAGPGVHQDFIQKSWIKCLPDKIRSVVECLSSHKCCHFKLLTDVADRVHEVLEPTAEPQTNEAAVPSSTSIECLKNYVEHLAKQVQSLKPRVQQCTPRFKGGYAPQATQTLRTNVAPAKNMPNPCRYHTKYGIKICKMRQG